MTSFRVKFAHTRRAAGFGAALVFYGLSLVATSQTPAPENDLRTLRAIFRQNLLGAILPEKRSYAAQLREVEKKLATARDYAAALRVRDERLALEQEITACEQELPALTARASGHSTLLPERIIFRPKDAVLSGGVRQEKDGSLGGWTTKESSATWKLPPLPPGGYEVVLRYACAPGEGGNFYVQEGHYFLAGKTAPTDDKPVEKNFGTLRLRDHAETIILSAEGVPRSNLMRLISVELAPASR